MGPSDITIAMSCRLFLFLLHLIHIQCLLLPFLKAKVFHEVSNVALPIGFDLLFDPTKSAVQDPASRLSSLNSSSNATSPSSSINSTDTPSAQSAAKDLHQAAELRCERLWYPQSGAQYAKVILDQTLFATIEAVVGSRTRASR